MRPTRLLLFSCLLFNAYAAPTIASVRLSQTTAVVATPTPVVVTASITDPSLIPGGANLLQVDANGKTIATLGILHDDGLNGDQFAGDMVYTLSVTLNSPSSSQAQFQVSAAFKGVLQRVRSSTMSLWFQPADAPNQAIALLAQSLAAGDRNTALNYFVPADKVTTTLKTVSPQELNALAAMLNGSVLLMMQNDLRIFQAPFVDASGKTTTVEFSMVPGATGQWLINRW